MKQYIQSHKILPGDAVYFNWTDSSRYVDHIGIYLCPASSDGSYIWTIEGNISNGVYKKRRKSTLVQGIGQLFTNNEFSS